MSGSIFGSVFRVSTWGESHGKALGAVIDGCPAGIELDEEDFREAMKRRSPGQTRYSTPRSEEDRVEILSGVFEGKTTGTPISLMIQNTSQRSGDYGEIAELYRPGHADYTFDAKYGFRDYRGGGRSSGRETAARVAAGCIAGKLLEELGINVTAYVKQIGPHSCVRNIYKSVLREYNPEDSSFRKVETGFVPNRDLIEKSPLRMPDPDASAAAEEYLTGLMEQGDSAGGVIECIATGVMPGLGDPVFDKLDAALAGAIFSIGAVKGVEIGDGFEVKDHTGSQNNDGFCLQDGEKSDIIAKMSNHSGGVLGGISDGSDIVLRAAFKPTPSIHKQQRTVNRSGKEVDISIGGRHDPVILPRAVVVVESMVQLVLADMLLKNMSAKVGDIKRFYDKDNIEKKV